LHQPCSSLSITSSDSAVALLFDDEIVVYEIDQSNCDVVSQERIDRYEVMITYDGEAVHEIDGLP